MKRWSFFVLSSALAGCGQGPPACARLIADELVVSCIELPQSDPLDCTMIGAGWTSIAACPPAIARCDETDPPRTLHYYLPLELANDRASCAGTFVLLAGTPPPDPCVAVPSSVGCNGFASDTPAPDQPDGPCTNTGTTQAARGTCAAGSLCMAPPGSSGVCHEACVPTAEISTGGCPTGHRCVHEPNATVGLCYRDCDAAHPCPTGTLCHPTLGACVP